MNRRQFMKSGGIFMASALTMPHLLSSCENLSSSSNGNTNLALAMEHFGVSSDDLQKVIQMALSKGGDYADLFFEHTITNRLSLENGEVNSGGANVDYGVGIRVLNGDQTGYAFVENVTLLEMLQAAKTAAQIANTEQTVQPVKMTLQPIKNNHYAILSAWEDMQVQNKIPYLKKLNDLVNEADERVIKVNVNLTDQNSHILFCNSEGMLYHDYRPMGVMGVMCVMQDGGKTENGSSNRSYRMGSEFLNDQMIKDLADEAVSIAQRSFLAALPDGGEMPVVMGSGQSGILLHEAIGHAFEADFNRKNTSIFSDQLHKKICSEAITVIDDATIPNNRGSVNFDDEGIEGQKTYIVKNGVLNSYLHDRISAKHYGIPSTGNGRRESFRNAPIPRMRATYMEGGDVTQDDIIRSVKKGIFVDHFSNGQVQIGAGDFTFFAKSGYLIEDGKLTQPLKDINIIGNGPQALADITMVANNPRISNGGWTCGKDGQSCPVTCGMPSALVSKLTVGGK